MSYWQTSTNIEASNERRPLCPFAKWLLILDFSLPRLLTTYTHLFSPCVCVCVSSTAKSHNWYQLRYWYLTVEHKKNDINFIKCDYMIMIAVYFHIWWAFRLYAVLVCCCWFGADFLMINKWNGFLLAAIVWLCFVPYGSIYL